ncbi:MAG TPA: CoB--CoM heterodisulfide reductase [Flavobacteriales bacterium]|nr:CoB--CoM heterodisulfide reductase [Flavobacteriales bacterium]
MSLQVKTMAEWMAEGKEPEVLFWVGSAGAFDDRAKKITRAFVKIMNKAGVQFGILGAEESASGDVAKRAGNEFLFMMQAMTNIQVMNAYNVKRIVTTCPHDFNTLKNEYKDLGGEYEVMHHTEFITKLIEENKLQVSSSMVGKKVTFHDPCYLGRGNEIFDAPRELLKLTGVELIEMKRSKRNSLCCGAGGAQMFKEAEPGEKEINMERTEEALALKPDVIATGCPFCNTMMTDGVKYNDKQEETQVLDVAEMIAQANDL